MKKHVYPTLAFSHSIRFMLRSTVTSASLLLWLPPRISYVISYASLPWSNSDQGQDSAASTGKYYEHRSINKRSILTDNNLEISNVYSIPTHSISTLQSYSFFQTFLREKDPEIKANAQNVKKAIFCSGKLYYELLQERETRGVKVICKSIHTFFNACVLQDPLFFCLDRHRADICQQIQILFNL